MKILYLILRSLKHSGINVHFLDNFDTTLCKNSAILKKLNILAKSLDFLQLWNLQIHFHCSRQIFPKCLKKIWITLLCFGVSMKMLKSCWKRGNTIFQSRGHPLWKSMQSIRILSMSSRSRVFSRFHFSTWLVTLWICSNLKNFVFLWGRSRWLKGHFLEMCKIPFTTARPL